MSRQIFEGSFWDGELVRAEQGQVITNYSDYSESIGL
jgi:hypothetical protein